LMLCTSRPFCKVICPLGAILSLFNRISYFRLWIDEGKCVRCGRCYRRCPMGLKVYEEKNALDCIRCFNCKSCPNGAVILLR
jgi:polyferredoxin